MPELPEVETVVRTLRPHVANRTVLSWQVVGASSCLVPESRPLEDLAGFTVQEVFRRGKYIAMRLAKEGLEDLFLVVHLRMTGRLIAYEKEAAAASGWPPSFAEKHIRAAGLLADEAGQEPACALVFHDVRKFGRLFAGTKAELESWSSWKKLGPEPLLMGADAFVQAVRGSRAIKQVLLDQTVLAGVGNIYADESLFAARIHPQSCAGAVPEDALRTLYAELCRLLLLSIEECGSSIRDYQDADGNVGAFQNHFAVYGRKDQPCRTCGTTLKRIVLNGRGTVFCPCCQKEYRQAGKKQ